MKILKVEKDKVQLQCDAQDVYYTLEALEYVVGETPDQFTKGKLLPIIAELKKLKCDFNAASDDYGIYFGRG